MRLELISPVSKRYALAFLEYLNEEGADLNEVMSEMSFLLKLAQEDKAFRTLITSPTISTDLKRELLMTALKGLSLHTRRLLSLLLTKRREALLPEIASAFIKMARGAYRVTLIVSHRLSPAQEVRLRDLLAKALRRRVDLEVEVDEDILGGLIVLLEDRMIDASLRRRLELALEVLRRDSSWLRLSSPD